MSLLSNAITQDYVSWLDGCVCDVSSAGMFLRKIGEDDSTDARTTLLDDTLAMRRAATTLTILERRTLSKDAAAAFKAMVIDTCINVTNNN